MKFLMTSLMLGLLCISRAGYAASTDTVNIMVYSYEPVAAVPVEQKVVELHITLAEKPEEAESKYRKPKKENFAHHATCSGAFVNDNGDILTARHCTADAASIDVVTYDNQEYRATIIATSTAHDLALIHIDRTSTPHFELATNVRRGQDVFVLGSPLGETNTMSEGIVAKLSGDVTLLDCSVLPGNSGGPAFDRNDQLIGITTAGYIVLYGTTHLNIAQGLDAVRFFLEDVKKNRK